MAKEYRRPTLTVDAIIFDDEKGILLVERGRDPYKGKYALPGGHVDHGETVETAVVRELEEETGVKGRIKRLFGVYSDPDRDPRGHYVSLVYELVIEGGELQAGDDAANARFFHIEELPTLAFDHDIIVKDFLDDSKG